jgi:hypothetical protein
LRPFLIRTALVLISLALGWVAGGRYLTLFFDRLKTVPLQSLALDRLEYYSGSVIIGDIHLNMQPDTVPRARLQCDPANRVFFVFEQSAFLLGRRTTSPDRVHPDAYDLAPEPGDRASLTTSHSLFSWPTPLEMNFMTGHSPSRRRYLYYRLLWQKLDGSALDLLWRYEQGFYAGSGWSSPMIRDGSTGLLSVKIRPSRVKQPAVQAGLQ